MFLAEATKLTEARFMKQVLELAELFGWRSWHDRATNARKTCAACHAPLRCQSCGRPVRFARNDPGWPDLFLIRGDTLLAVELKSDRGRLTPAQWGWLDALRHVTRIVATTWKPADWPKIERMLRR